MNVEIDKNSKEPIYWQVFEQIKSAILSGAIQDGAALPSERWMANFLGVHRNTIIRAYGELKAEELIASKQGIGYRVTLENSNFANSWENVSGKAVNWDQMIKDEYRDMAEKFDSAFQRQDNDGKISMAVGIPPIIYDEKTIATDIAEILRENGRKKSYITPYQGDEECRRQICDYLKVKGISSKISQIQIMSETNQAFDFIMSATMKSGDRIIIEEPVSPDVYRLIDLNGCEAITVPVDENGMMCENIGALIEKYNPKYIYVNSSYHDPTGAHLSVERKKQLLKISYKYRLPIIEDDSGSELNFFGDQEPTIKSMDWGNNVIYIYSFGLTFIPGLSIAFIAASEELVKSLRYLVSVRIMSLEWVAQKLISKCLSDGTYSRKTAEIRRRNRENFRLACPYLDQLSKHGVSYFKPKGGVYIWCTLPKGIDSRELVAEAERRGVLFIAGTVFYLGKNGGKDKLRINFSHEKGAMIIQGMKILTRIIKEKINNSNGV